ncbi:MAG: hypothetical protein LBQ13_01495 [Endomicrobium sp.]|jgi:hypothetical protein|nr:hypothetical protein [Endomicrobium sp.]
MLRVCLCGRSNPNKKVRTDPNNSNRFGKRDLESNNAKAVRNHLPMSKVKI